MYSLKFKLTVAIQRNKSVVHVICIIHEDDEQQYFFLIIKAELSNQTKQEWVGQYETYFHHIAIYLYLPPIECGMHLP